MGQEMSTVLVSFSAKMVLCILTLSISVGTCVPLCIVAFLYKLLGISSTEIIFVESFCRVKKLSLTGRILYHIADKFIVLWPELVCKYPRAEYLGDMKS